MGEQAEMIVDGFNCDQCGCMIDGESPGHPRNCGCSGSEEPKKPHRRHSNKRRRKTKDRRPHIPEKDIPF